MSAALDHAPDWTIPQAWERYTETEHRTWTTLYERQAALLPNRACNDFLAGLKALDFYSGGIPDFRRLSEKLMRLTGWQVVAVPGLVPEEIFFEHLANRRFPAGNFIRRPDQLDYLEEPDVFHDVFGHVPMLTNPIFADYMQAYGRGGLRAQQFGHLGNLARLYWYTVEFGLLNTPEGLRIYGAGIVSSRTETIFALEDASPNRLGFNLKRVLRTPYRIDDFQQNYFVIDALQSLLDETVQTDFSPLYAELNNLSEIPIAAIEQGDRVFTHGTQHYAATH
jgi:phenylalanine-4-hydroxylase